MSAMMAWLLALAQVATAPSAVAQASPPADWSPLPELRYLRRLPIGPELSAFVRDEVLAGRCGTAVRGAQQAMLTIDLAVLVGTDGKVRRIVPRAIDCVTVEQYASGLVSKLARDNLGGPAPAHDTWFRTTLIFAWAG